MMKEKQEPMVSFQERLQAINPHYETFAQLQTIQINLGNLCNLTCTHCHVNASSHGNKVMPVAVIEEIVAFLSRHPGLILDITGGSPEMNPHFRTLIERTAGLCTRRLLRSNLAIMAEAGWEWLAEFCREQELVIVASLPCYLPENVDAQRGEGVYAKSIEVLKLLNSLGYGSAVELNLVYNPGGNFIPAAQGALAAAYKEELASRHGIKFNHLFTITNAPIGRFKEQLEATGEYQPYLQLLARSFNAAAAAKIMCRTLLSIDWQGIVYNCDFNQALQLPLTTEAGRPVTIAALAAAEIAGQKIQLGPHCYCCTAGEGSSCTGALVV